MRLVSRVDAFFFCYCKGTFFLVFAVSVNVTGKVDANFAGVSIGVTLMVSVFFGGHISGGAPFLFFKRVIPCIDLWGTSALQSRGNVGCRDNATRKDLGPHGLYVPPITY